MVPFLGLKIVKKWVLREWGSFIFAGDLFRHQFFRHVFLVLRLQDFKKKIFFYFGF